MNAINKIITVKLYISPSPNWVRWQIVRAMFGSCMRFSALCNNWCCVMNDVLQLWDFELFHTLDGKSVLLLKAHHPLIYQGWLNVWINSFSPPLSLYLHAVYLHGAVPLLCFDHMLLICNTNAHIVFPRSYYVCLVTSVSLVQRPLKAMSAIFPSPSSLPLYLSTSLSHSQQHHLWRRPARCLKVALVLFEF